jgi:hypothetical protein
MSTQAMDAVAYTDADRDALHILPLAILPLANPGLRRTRLIKNARFETVLEMFRGQGSGSGQISIDGIRANFSGDPATFEDDIAIVEALAEAPSFDVYSLRLILRSHNLKIENAENLKLSPDMQAQLTSYMKVFTRPLVQKVFGEDGKDLSSASEIIGMFRDVDREVAMKRIKTISEALGLEVDQIPGFLEDYGDIFMSLAYYRRYIDRIRPEFEAFKAWMKEGIAESHLKQHKETLAACEYVETHVEEAIRFILRRFAFFDDTSRVFWTELSQDRYVELRLVIQGHYLCIAGMLCGLSSKMDAWREKFPTGGGSPNNRKDFVMTEMVPGLDLIRALEKDAPPAESF